MRSRYTAYAVGAVQHLIATTAPESPHRGADPGAWRSELAQYCAVVEFTGLDVLGAQQDGDHGRVQFVASYVHAGAPGEIREDSRFVRRDGRWLYVDGVSSPPRS